MITAAEALAAIGQLSGSIGHELRNPLACFVLELPVADGRDDGTNGIPPADVVTAAQDALWTLA